MSVPLVEITQISREALVADGYPVATTSKSFKTGKPTGAKPLAGPVWLLWAPASRQDPTRSGHPTISSKAAIGIIIQYAGDAALHTGANNDGSS